MSLLESIASSMGPDLAGKLAGALGADTAAVTKGLGAMGPLLMSGMTKMAGSSGGADALLKMIPQSSGGLLGNLLGGLFGGGSAAASGSLLNSLFGQSTSAVAGSLSRALGFNAGPLLGLAAPAVMGALGKLVKEKGLDAAGLAGALKDEVAAFSGNAANRDTMALIEAAMASGDKAKAMIAGYGADWGKVMAGPAAALAAVASADLSGPIDSMKEVQAASEAMSRLARQSAPDSVLQAAFGGGLTTEMLAKMREFAPRKDALVDLIKGGAAAVAARSPADAKAYKDAILAVAQATAEASKDGGFLGIGGKQISDDEQRALDALKAALA
jgi:hypothetical protein